MELRPNLLLHHDKPLPLTGVCPRTIMGRTEWDGVRFGVYAAYDDHCGICGISKADAFNRLDCHEVYDIGWDRGIVTFTEYVALCWYCHNFIHADQFTGVAPRRNYKPETVRNVIRHGWRVLREAELPLRREWPSWRQIPWDKWKLVWRGKEYVSNYYSEQEWLDSLK